MFRRTRRWTRLLISCGNGSSHYLQGFDGPRRQRSWWYLLQNLESNEAFDDSVVMWCCTNVVLCLALTDLKDDRLEKLPSIVDQGQADRITPTLGLDLRLDCQFWWAVIMTQRAKSQRSRDSEDRVVTNRLTEKTCFLHTLLANAVNKLQNPLSDEVFDDSIWWYVVMWPCTKIVWCLSVVTVKYILF